MNAIITDNRPSSFAFTGSRAWHGLGTQLGADATIEDWRKAVFDYDLKMSPAIFDCGDGILKKFSERQIIYRTDTLEPLSVVSNRYQVDQPSEVCDWFGRMAERYGFGLETMGTFRRGAKYFALARTNAALDLNGDALDTFMCFVTSCDGSLNRQAFTTYVRVVCENTLKHALDAKGKNQAKSSHRSVFNPDQMEIDLGLMAAEQAATFKEACEILCNTRMSEEENLIFISDVLDMKMKSRSAIGILESIYDSPGAQLDSASGTLWGTVNGFTYWTDHARNYRSEDNRMEAALLTQQDKKADFFTRAYDYALAGKKLAA